MEPSLLQAGNGQCLEKAEGHC